MGRLYPTMALPYIYSITTGMGPGPMYVPRLRRQRPRTTVLIMLMLAALPQFQLRAFDGVERKQIPSCENCHRVY